MRDCKGCGTPFRYYRDGMARCHDCRGKPRPKSEKPKRKRNPKIEAIDTVTPYRCGGCGYLIELAECQICKAIRYTESACGK